MTPSLVKCLIFNATLWARSGDEVLADVVAAYRATSPTDDLVRS